MKYNSKFKLGTVVLNVNNLEKETQFYTTSIGLDIINQNEKSVDLGIKEDNSILITLRKTNKKILNSAGLYHIAILLPSRKDLGNILKHFIKNEVKLIGAANHGYSEAIYLEDLEKNGIEVYADTPVDTWDIRETGEIIGITEEIDAQGVLNSATKTEFISYKMPKGTTVGHVHLTVKNSMDSTNFYQKTLLLNNKMTFSSASWIASGNYHHHIAVNNWKGPNIVSRTPELPGLSYFTIIFNNRNYYNELLENIKSLNVEIKENKENSFIINDLDGIEIKILFE